MSDENGVVEYIAAPGMVMAAQTNKEADIEMVRDNLIDVTMKGKTALNDLVELAQTSQDYHMYDSIAKVITALTGANIQLAGLSDVDPKATKTHEEKKQINNTMNFIGTSSDFIDQIMNKVKERQEEADDAT